MQDTRLIGDEPTLVFTFLESYHQACIYSEASELEATLMLKEFLFAKARALFISVVHSDQTETGLRDWSTAVNWLHRMTLMIISPGR